MNFVNPFQNLHADLANADPQTDEEREVLIDEIGRRAKFDPRKGGR